MGKRIGPSRAELEEAKQAELEYESALQRQRMSKARLRKKENHQKFQHGGLIQQVALHELPSDLLFGGLLILKGFLEQPGFKAEAQKRGERALALAAQQKRARKVQEIVVAFDLAPPAELLAALKSLGMKFNPRHNVWRGSVGRDRLARAIRACDWEKHVDRIDYAQPPENRGE